MSYKKEIAESKGKKQAVARGEIRTALDELISELFYTAVTESKAVYKAYNNNKKAAESGDKIAQEVDKLFSILKD